MTKKISIFGSTGSIGEQTLDVISKSPRGMFDILALTANSNISRLEKQAHLFKPKFVVINDDSKYKELKSALSSLETKVLSGDEGTAEVASLQNDQVVAGISGSAGLQSTYLALKKGSDVLFANKESLVCAGKLLKETAQKSGAKLIPLDSEHNAIFQVTESENKSAINKIILTASGGPFRGYSLENLKNITLEQALKHPNWVMGKKITIDSATLFNKGLEIIEAYYLFDMPLEKIEVVVHPESIIHSMVQYDDGSTLAQLGNHDMRIPICHGLYWPQRYKGEHIVKSLDFTQIKSLNFEEPDHKAFPSLNICREAMRLGKTFPIALNASNEIAVDCFLKKRIGFLDIFKIVEKSLETHTPENISSINDIILLDKKLRKEAGIIADRLHNNKNIHCQLEYKDAKTKL